MEESNPTESTVSRTVSVSGLTEKLRSLEAEKTRAKHEKRGWRFIDYKDDGTWNAQLHFEVPKNIAASESKKTAIRTIVLLVAVTVLGAWCYNLDDIEGDVADALGVAQLDQDSLEGRVVSMLLLEIYPSVEDWAGSKELPSLISVSKTMQAEGDMKGTFLVDLEYRNRASKDGLLYRAKNVMEAIFKGGNTQDVGIVMLRPHVVFLDELGNDTPGQAAKIVLSRKVASRMKWEEIDTEAFERIVQKYGDFWLHPALR